MGLGSVLAVNGVTGVILVAVVSVCEPGALASWPSAHEGSKGRRSPLLRVALEPHSIVLPSKSGRQVYSYDTGSVNLDPSGRI